MSDQLNSQASPDQQDADYGCKLILINLFLEEID